MCLSNVYKKTTDENKFLLKNIANVKIENEKLIFTDLMGVRNEFFGRIIEINLLENEIIIEVDD